MSRAEFMRQLEKLLQDIPENDRLDAIAYYNDYFDEAGPENEAQVIQELGSPEKVASTIKGELEPEKAEPKEEKKEDKKEEKTEEKKEEGTKVTYPTPEYREPEKKKKTPWVLILFLVVFASPMLLAIGGGLLGGIVGLLAALVVLVIGFVIASIVLAVSGLFLFFLGILRVFFSPLEGMVTIGIGSLFFALGIVCLVLFLWGIFKWIPALFRGCAKLIRKIFGKKKKEE